MRYVSTRGKAPAATLGRALRDGLAPDAGLYMPERMPEWSPDDMLGFAVMPLGELGARVLAPFVGSEVAADKLLAIVDDALNFPIPLVEIEPGIRVLELFHGPTLAFKDVAMQLLARLYDHALARQGRRLTIVCATSGDTGGAAVEAFRGRANVRLVALFPEGPATKQ